MRNLENSAERAEQNAAEQMIVRQAFAGNEAAYTVLFHKYYPKLRDFANNIVDDYHVSEEIAQQTFLNTLLQKATYKNQGLSFGAYLYRAAKNIALNHVRKEKRSSPASVDVMLEILQKRERQKDDLPLNLVAAEMKSNLEKAINSLEAKQKNVVRLKLEGEGNIEDKEIAERMDTTVSSVKSLFWRAKRNLREFIEKNG